MNSYKKTVLLEANMQEQLLEPLPRFLERLGLDEEPMGVFYTDEKPLEGFSPKPIDLPTRANFIKPMSCLLPCPIRCLAIC